MRAAKIVLLFEERYLTTSAPSGMTGSDGDSEAVGLRLKSRAAALLFTEEDTSRAIFDDVGRLYSIRSTLVHGASLKQPRLLSLLRQISTTPQDAFPGTTVWHAVDRLRDIVRRAFLARMCLAEGDDPVWPINKEFVIDALLSDDAIRSEWRNRWRQRITDLGAPNAVERARPAVDTISRDDR